MGKDHLVDQRGLMRGKRKGKLGATVHRLCYPSSTRSPCEYRLGRVPFLNPSAIFLRASSPPHIDHQREFFSSSRRSRQHPLAIDCYMLTSQRFPYHQQRHCSLDSRSSSRRCPFALHNPLRSSCISLLPPDNSSTIIGHARSSFRLSEVRTHSLILLVDVNE